MGDVAAVTGVFLEGEIAGDNEGSEVRHPTGKGRNKGLSGSSMAVDRMSALCLLASL